MPSTREDLRSTSSAVRSGDVKASEPIPPTSRVGSVDRITRRSGGRDVSRTSRSTVTSIGEPGGSRSTPQQAAALRPLMATPAAVRRRTRARRGIVFGDRLPRPPPRRHRAAAGAIRNAEVEPTSATRLGPLASHETEEGEAPGELLRPAAPCHRGPAAPSMLAPSTARGTRLRECRMPGPIAKGVIHSVDGGARVARR
jgi:hypothetical protein